MSIPVSFPVRSYRRFLDPSKPGATHGFAFCRVLDLPDGLPDETDPRQQNLDSPVAKQIRRGLLAVDFEPTSFHNLNRGILISAAEAHFDTEKKQLTLHLRDTSKHGIVDGGHTYAVIQAARAELENLDDPQEANNLRETLSQQFVLLEIMTGIEGYFEQVARSRNTSVQVKEKSLAELQDKFDMIKDALSRQPYASEIAYKEFEGKEIDIQEIIAILTIFLNREFSNGNHPTRAYSSRAATLKLYLDKPEEYRALMPVAAQILRLHDFVKYMMPNLHKQTGLDKSGKGKFGKLKEIKTLREPQRLWFFADGNCKPQEIKYEIPSGLVYPLLGALRYLLAYNDERGQYEWIADPFEFFKGPVGKELVAQLFELSEEWSRNPQTLGKKSPAWRALYNTVARAFLEAQPKSA